MSGGQADATTPILTGPVPTLPPGVRIRSASLADREQIARFIAGLSAQNRFFRFFTGLPAVSGRHLRALCGGDGADALIATATDEVIGHAMVTGSSLASGPPAGDLAVVVADAWHGHSIAAALAVAAAHRAVSRGVHELTMDVLGTNRAALLLIARLCPDAHRIWSDGMVHVHIPVGPSPGREYPP
jgi:GNAT superfamily N-acetyltransferase